MKPPASLTRRLIITLTTGALVLWLLASIASIAVLRDRLDAAFDGGLRETAERLLPLVFEGQEADEEPGTPPEAPHFDDRPGEYIVYQVRAADGRLLMRSHDAPETPFAAPLDEGFATAWPWRIFTLATPDRAVVVQVAEDIEHRGVSLRDSALALLLPIALFVPLSALGILLAVRSGLRPVQEVSREIGLRRASNLTPVPTDGLPRELRPIAEEVNGLIARLQAAIEAERSLAANSAHELRTPLAASLAQTQMLVAELAGHPEEGRARQVEASLVRLRHLSEKLLQLARADAGLGQAAEAHDLLPAIRVIVEGGRRQADAGGRLELDEGGLLELRAAMDIDAFDIVLRNVIENALRHSPSSSSVMVRLSAGEVSVVNSGPVVAAGELAALTQRFKRGATRAEGAGLGLAIVDTIMRQSAGSLVLASPAHGRPDGFEAKLILPQP